MLTGHYDLHETQLLGQITTARFINPQNLLAIKSDRCSATEDSGTPIIFPPNTSAKLGSDTNGILINASGHHVTGYKADFKNQIIDELVDIQPFGQLSPPSTHTIQLTVNLNANASAPAKMVLGRYAEALAFQPST